MSSVDNESAYALALADLGQKVLNAITASQILGHADMRNTAPYVHDASLASRVVLAIANGTTSEAVSALREWRAGCIAEMGRTYGLAVDTPQSIKDSAA